MQSKEIRSRFLEFFKLREHEIVPSDSLVPRQDPTLLFTSAGMNQFKEQFMGSNITFRRAASSQKCLRTGDLDKVGKTPGHHTFFEMLGNFSFGNYFKKEAIFWAWEFMTDVLKMPDERLWVSVYEKDDEARRVWEDSVKAPKEKIIKLGAKENFWPSNAPTEGPNGPCGPCSEIFYDWGEDTGCRRQNCNPACDCGRFVEVWNLVFTQFDRQETGELKELPNKNIDTGMGLERITAVMQGVKTNFETDLFAPIIEDLKNYVPPGTGKGKAKPKDAALNAIADHVRACAFAIADGVAPSNEERGYVVRKLIRRAYLYAGANKPFLYNIVPKISKLMGDIYPEVAAKREEIAVVIKDEEERFRNTLDTALPILDGVMKGAKRRIIPGNELFKLVDTYGLPIEVIETEALSKDLKLDLDGFNKLMESRRELSRSTSKIQAGVFEEKVISKAPLPASTDKVPPITGKIAFLAKDDKRVNAVKEGDIAEVITDPMVLSFYAEAGGEVGDSGTIEAGNARFAIKNTYNISARLVHFGEVAKGTLKVGDSVTVRLDTERKARIARNHTATHLLQAALRKVLGEHVQQAGSLVVESRLRFDFTHMKKLSARELNRVEEVVNEYIDSKDEVKKEIKTYERAKAEGAIALFGEKYGNRVRVVSIGDYSKELCGGTHLDNTHQIGIFKILSESSIASGIRRIEAITSDEVLEWLKEDMRKVATLADSELKEAEYIGKKAGAKLSAIDGTTEETIRNLKNMEPTREYVFVWSRVERPELLSLLERLRKEKADLLKEMRKSATEQFRQRIDSILSSARDINGVKVLSTEVESEESGSVDLKKALDMLKEKAKEKKQPLIAVLGSTSGGKVSLVAGATKELAERKFHAGELLKEVAKIVGGAGGGRPDFAQAGGKNAAKLGEALKKVFKLAEGML